MFSLSTYTFLHHLGLMMTFLSLGGLAALAMAGQGQSKARAPFVALHGVALFVVLVAGFGWAAKVGYGVPIWVILKLLVWLSLGALIVPLKRKPELAKPFVLYLLPALAAVAIMIAVWHGPIFGS